MTNTPKRPRKTTAEASQPLQKKAESQDTQNNQQEMSPEQLAYYSALLQAWVGTKMEKDKSLLTLSSFGIGLIGSLLTAIGANSGAEIFFYGLAIAFFLVTIISSLVVFGKNAKHLEKEVKSLRDNKYEKINDKCLDNLDKLMFWCFIFGLIIFLVIGVLSSYNKLTKGDKKDESQKQQVNIVNTSSIIR